MPLSYENAEYLSLGKLKEKGLYASLFNRISDYVIGIFNESVRALDRPIEASEMIFELRRLTAKLGLLTFYRKPEFIRAADSAALTASLKEATEKCIDGLYARYGNENADLSYETARLRRVLENGDR